MYKVVDKNGNVLFAHESLKIATPKALKLDCDIHMKSTVPKVKEPVVISNDFLKRIETYKRTVMFQHRGKRNGLVRR